MATAARARTTKSSSPADSLGTPEDDGVPSFTSAEQKAVAYDGPVLFRVDKREFRMRSDRSFGASLVYLRRLGDGRSTVRQAQFELLDHVAGAEATEALIHAAEIDPTRWATVVSRALEHVIGQIKEDPGN